MKFLMGDCLARRFNLTGQSGKRAFKPLLLFEVVFGKEMLCFPHKHIQDHYAMHTELVFTTCKISSIAFKHESYCRQ